MAVGPRRPVRKAAAPARKAAPAKPSRDVKQYADKEPTPYHKAFATWLLKDVGVRLEGKSVKAAFLLGVSTATASRPAFQESDFLEEWREKTGESKPGRKPAAEAAPAPATRRRKPEPEPEQEEDEEEWEEDDDAEESDDEFEDDSDDEADSDDEDWEDEEEEPAPAPKRRAPAKAATSGRPAKSAPAPARKAPAKRAAKPADDDDYIF